VLSVGCLVALAVVPWGAQAQREGALAGNRLYVARVILTGKAAKPRGEPAGFGSVTICIDRSANRIAFGFDQLRVNGPPTSGHIHRGRAGTTGPVVFPFEAPGPIDPLVGDVQWVGASTAPPATVAALVASPANHYVDVHTKKHPGGAVRGQLGPWKRPLIDDPAAAACGIG